MGIDREIDVQGFQFKKTFSTHAGAGLHYIFLALLLHLRYTVKLAFPEAC